jgi:restriction system protein
VTDVMNAADSAVPIWPALVVPVLTALSDGETLHRKDLFDRAADVIGLSPAARAETLASGGKRYEQRMGWALSHLSKAGWVDRPARGYYALNNAGRTGLHNNPNGFDYAAARDFFAPFWPNQKAQTPTSVLDEAFATNDIIDPIEQIENGIRRIDREVAEELLDRLHNSHPDFFEEAVIHLLLAMGYGGTELRAKRTGGTGDGGIDGVIDQDALGLDRIYIQAKRYKEGNNIGSETVQAFVGAIHGFGASRGIFLTTSTFTPAAINYTNKVASRVILIDGERLATLMIKYRVGVQAVRTYTAVKIDSDFFE